MREVLHADEAVLQARQVDRACDQFERAWKGDGRPRIEDLLGSWDGAARSALLRELVPLEVYYRRRLGEDCSVSDYLARFPELGAPWLTDALAACTPRAEGRIDRTTSFHDRRSAADTCPLLSGPCLGEYELIEEISRGGMGVVYKARQIGLGRTVAIKMILAGPGASAAEVRRFHSEAESVAALDHPHIVPIYEIGAHEGMPFFAMKFVEGGSLAQHLPRFQAEPRSAVRLLVTVARAVHHAHQRGILHRDLKPANVLLDGPADGPLDGRAPLVTDFGLAQRLVEGAAERSGPVAGTPGYIAPEQLARGAPASVAVDIYALGAILYECLTGQRPFRADTPLGTLLKGAAGEPPSPRALASRLDRDLDAICCKALAPRPEERYASAEALAQDLERWLAGEPVLARPCGLPRRALKWAKRRPAAAALVLLLLGGLVLALGAVVRQHSQEKQARLDNKVREAALLSQVLREFQDLYSTEVMERVQPLGVSVSHDYQTRDGTVPLPSTLTMALGRRLSARDATVLLYSDVPFPRRQGQVLDDFAQEALRNLRDRPSQPFYRFEDRQGRRVLRYATADVMGANCVICHNSHPQSPKRDWQVGDVRGALEIILPLEE
jgi:hypothetical protein